MVPLAAYVRHILLALHSINSMVFLIGNHTSSKVLDSIIDAFPLTTHQLVNVDVLQVHPDKDTPLFFVDITAKPMLIVSLVSHSFERHRQFLHNEVVDYYAYAHLIVAHNETAIAADLQSIFPSSAAIIVAVVDRSNYNVHSVTTAIPAQWRHPLMPCSATLTDCQLSLFRLTVTQRLHRQSLIRQPCKLIELSLSVCANMEMPVEKGSRKNMITGALQKYFDSDYRLSIYVQLFAGEQANTITNSWPLSVRQQSGRIARSVISHPTWSVGHCVLAAPNWWHSRLAPADRSRLVHARSALIFSWTLSWCIFVVRWLAAVATKQCRPKDSQFISDLMFDTLARACSVAVPERALPPGRMSGSQQLLVLLGLMTSLWGIMVCNFVASALFDMSMMSARWQPVFQTVADVWSHDWLPIINERNFMQLGDQNIRNRTGRVRHSSAELGFDGREARIMTLVGGDESDKPIFQLKHKANGTLVYRKFFDQNCMYKVCMTHRAGCY